MNKQCAVTGETYDWKHMRMTGKDEWTYAPLCRETGHYFYTGDVTTEQVKEYMKVKDELWKLHRDTLILLSKLARNNESGFKAELKIFKEIEQEYSEEKLKKDRTTLTMFEHIQFLKEYIKELKDLGIGNVELSTKDYDYYKEQFLKGRSYMDLVEIV